MRGVIELHQDVLTKKVPIDSLKDLKESFFKPCYHLIMLGKSIQAYSVKEIGAFIRLCNDYYTYSENGDTLISDTEYDKIVSKYNSMTKDRIIYADIIPDYTTWPFITHTAPGMVGSINKIYTEEELQKYLGNLSDIEWIILAPKFDGISACIEKRNGRMEYAVTRADGSKGQNILPVVRGAKNASVFSDDGMPDGFYKVELCVTQSDYDELILSKRYANRRSATSGIINSPKNLPYANYITIIPLAYFNGKNTLNYLAPGQKKIKYSRKSSVVLEEIENILNVIRKSDFPIRTDGVVLFPESSNILINPNDIMHEAIAYKVNTAEALTTVNYGYMSVGRLGNAVPMIKVQPVEVNETIVTDVSLGSYDKYASMDIHDGETVIVYSAGDVIPQMKLPEKRTYPEDAPYLKIKKACPYCEEKLERIGNEYKCTNTSCIRIKTGKIINFLVKLGSKNISDKTIEDLYNAKMVRSIEDLFELDSDKIAELPGYSDVSANNITTEIKRISEITFPVSELFGAIGIPNISEKKCRNIFKYITITNVLEDSKKKIVNQILNADNVGGKTADDFTDFVIDNRPTIRYLLKHMKIIRDINYLGNVVFTGFRDEELAKQFEILGYECSDSVNSRTVAVLTSGNNENSTKCTAARKKGISIVNLADVDTLLSELKNKKPKFSDLE